MKRFPRIVQKLYKFITAHQKRSFQRSKLNSVIIFLIIVVIFVFCEPARHHSNMLQVQKQPPELFCKKGALKNFEKLTGEQLCQSHHKS